MAGLHITLGSPPPSPVSLAIARRQLLIAGRDVGLAAPVSYSTAFAATENPISEGGIWLGGATNGLDWNDARSGLADNGTTRLGFGKQTLGVGPPPFTDSWAVLKSASYPFSANHKATGTIYSSTGVTGEHECELLLRFSISAHACFGYEVSVVDGNLAYLVCIGSNFSGNNSGANGIFHILVNGVSTNVNGSTGSVFVAEAAGTVISLKCNGNTCFSYDTSGDAFKISSGQPGFGLYTDNSLGAQSGNNTYGWSAWSATDS